MKSPFYFIAKPANGKRYDNIKQIGGIATDDVNTVTSNNLNRNKENE